MISHAQQNHNINIISLYSECYIAIGQSVFAYCQCYNYSEYVHLRQM